MEPVASAGGENVGWDALGLPILFEGPHELTVIKPAGMATELTSDPKGVSLIARVRAAAARDAAPKLPHRLDRVTRGIVVVALSADAIRFHNESLRDRTWEKVYLARVNGTLSDRPERWIGVHMVHLRTRGGRSIVVRSGGKRAVTEILALAPTPDREDEAHALLRLHTGRYHQIRATMAHLGAPLVDDWLYADPVPPGNARFYLEHVALRFTPYGEERPRVLHRREDPDREPIDPSLRAALDRQLKVWEENDGEKR